MTMPEGKNITMKFEFGDKVKDTISGFEGVVCGYILYITGCAQYSVQPQTKENGEWVEGHWLDEDCIELVEAKHKEHAVTRAGAYGVPPAAR